MRRLIYFIILAVVLAGCGTTSEPEPINENTAVAEENQQSEENQEVKSDTAEKIETSYKKDGETIYFTYNPAKNSFHMTFFPDDEEDNEFYRNKICYVSAGLIYLSQSYGVDYSLSVMAKDYFTIMITPSMITATNKDGSSTLDTPDWMREWIDDSDNHRDNLESYTEWIYDIDAHIPTDFGIQKVNE